MTKTGGRHSEIKCLLQMKFPESVYNYSCSKAWCTQNIMNKDSEF